MELISSQLLLDDDFGEFGIWYQDGTNRNQFYAETAEDSFFHPYKQESPLQSVKSTTKFNSQSTHLKQTTYLSLETDARVPVFEASTRSVSCSSEEMVHHIGSQKHHHQHKDWDVFYQKSPLVGSPSEDSILSSIVPDMVEAENETFQDLTELLEQEYPLSKATSPQRTTPSSEAHLQVLNIQPCSPKMEDSQPSCSFSVDLTSPGSPPHGMDKRYKEMRRKNNIASKNARVARREKERQMEDRAKQLEEDNNVLRIKVRKMEDLAQELKTRLIQSVTGNK